MAILWPRRYVTYGGSAVYLLTLQEPPGDELPDLAAVYRRLTPMLIEGSKRNDESLSITLRLLIFTNVLFVAQVVLWLLVLALGH